MSSGSAAARVALVTGAGKGIGAAIARRFADDGYRLVLTGRRADRLEEVAAAIAERGGAADVCAGDVGSEADCERAVAAAGRLDVLVNNAGVLPPGKTILEVHPDEWDSVFNTNVRGAFLMTRAALPALLEKGGAVVTVGSVNSVMAGPISAAYCASKAAVLMLARCIAIDHGGAGVRSNCVLPGWVRSEMADADMDALASERGIDREAAYRLANRNVPFGRPATPQEVASAVAFLASPEASYINGAALAVDGGSTVIWPGVTEFLPEPPAP